MKVLRRTQFGNPILRAAARQLSPEDIRSPKVQELIADMYHTLKIRRYGVGLAAPQVGRPWALAIVNIQPTEARPAAKPFSLTVINPQIVRTYGRRAALWEGCISLGGAQDSVFARVPRYRKILVRYLDGKGEQHERTFEDLPAHVLQHEIDHLSGVLFVDRVKDTTSYVTLAEYKKRFRK